MNSVGQLFYKFTCLLSVFLFFSIVATAQKSIIFQTRLDVNTGYNNVIVEGDESYYVIQTTASIQNSLAGNDRFDIVVSKFDHCHVAVWSKVYYSEYSLIMMVATYHNDKLALIAKSGSSNKQILLLELDSEGNIILSKLYQHSLHDSAHNISYYDNNYHLFGGVFYAGNVDPSARSYIKINNQGQIVKSNLVRKKTASQIDNWGVSMGVVLPDESTIAKAGNSLVKINVNNDIEWAKQYDLDVFGILESDPILTSEGIVLQMKKEDHVFLMKVDPDGNTLWTSPSMDMIYYGGSISLKNDTIYMSSLSASKDAIVQAKINVENGALISINASSLTAFTDAYYPDQIVVNNTNDIIISTSHLINFSDHLWKDLIFINPQLSDCIASANTTTYPTGTISTEDVMDEFETLIADFSEEDFSVFSEDIADVYEEYCSTTQAVHIDTTLLCDQEYIFDNIFPNNNYYWSDGSTDSIRYFTEQQTIEADVISCESKLRLRLEIRYEECPCDVYVPNAFTPNGDKDNNLFKVRTSCDLDSYLLTIFDRWGGVVFQTNNPDEGWNGGVDGTYLMVDIYTYKLEYNKVGHSDLQIKFGSLSLLR